MDEIFANRRNRLRRMIAETGMESVTRFAEHFGYSRAQVSQYLSETYNDGRSLGERAARGIEERAGYPSGWLDRSSNDDNAPSKVSDTEAVTPVVIMGNATGLEMSEFERVTGELEVASVCGTTAYALIFKGSGGRPRFRSGDALIIDPRAEVGGGDDVIVSFTGGGMRILEFLWERDGEVTFGHANSDGPPVTFPKADVTALQRIVMIIPRASIRQR